MKRTLFVLLLLASRAFAQGAAAPALMLPDATETPRMKRWIDYHYGMFIHFNINTFVGTEHVPNPPPAATYAPPALDVDSWVRLARDAGMKYAVLTTKHDGGFCLWDSKAPWHGKEFDYDVAASGNKTDVVRAFVEACKKYDVAPGFYYCLPDSYSNPTVVRNNKFNWLVGKLPEDAFELVKAHLEELATNYPACHYFWLDIPTDANATQLQVLYALLRRKNPENVVLMNQHLAYRAKTGDQTLLKKEACLGDILNTEAQWRAKGIISKTQKWQGKTLFLGYEHCDMAGVHWFNSSVVPHSAGELFQLYRTTRTNGGNLLLDIGPTRAGVIPPAYRPVLLQLKEQIDVFEKSLAKDKP